MLGSSQSLYSIPFLGDVACPLLNFFAHRVDQLLFELSIVREDFPALVGWVGDLQGLMNHLGGLVGRCFTPKFHQALQLS